jgi:glycosyltransferase involved in cell wall biosynthesis
MENNIFLSVIIPCFNEENNLKNRCLDGVINYFKKVDFPYEIIVVNDASTDKSKEILETYVNHQGIRLINKEHSFKAGTVIRGIREAKGKYVLMTDMDQATPITQLDKFMEFLKKDKDIIIGSRRDERKGAPLSRKIMAKGFIFLRNLILGLNEIKDTQCGFKVFKREVAMNIVKKLKLFADNGIVSKTSKVTAGFDVEMLFLAKKMGYQIGEIPVIWNYVETRRVNPLRDSIDGLFDMLKIRLFSILKKYD